MTVDPIIPPADALESQAVVDTERPRFTLLEGGLSGQLAEVLTHVDDRIQPEVIAEVDALRTEGYDVNIVHPEQQVPLSETTERVLDVTANAMAQGKKRAIEMLFNREKYPALARWHALSKRAIALHTLYQSKRSDTLGEGIDPAVYDEPLFNGRSARDVVDQRYGAAKAATIVDKYVAFTSPDSQLETGVDEHGLTQGDYLAEVTDSRAVRTRATAAANAIRTHFTRRRAQGDGRPIVSASLACGAAGPIYEIVDELQAAGHNVAEVVLVDQDPMALATAQSFGKHVGVDDKVRLELRDLIKDNLTDYLPIHGVSVVDLLGFFEYIPHRITPRGLAKLALPGAAQKPGAAERAEARSFTDRLKNVALAGLRRYAQGAEKEGGVGYSAAADILGSLKDIVEPGGIIVFGNMLDKRPDQKFFETVWPKLHQRSVREVLQIVAEAGFDPKHDVTVDIPGEEGVYAVYTIRIPERQTQRPSLGQRIGRWVMKKVIADY